MTVTVKDIQKARENIQGKVKYSPMEYSKTLSEITGAEVWIKFENFQFTAAFKERGALNKLLSLNDDEKHRGVIAMSAGNHAQGVAYHAALLGIPATIVMPEGTPFTKIEHTRRHGARVIIHGRNLVEASNFAHKTCDEEGLVFVHPYDDELIIAGQGTLGFEMLETVPELETLVIPVGGGGLISGIAIAAKHLKPEIEIIGVEPAMYPSMNAALRQLKDVKCEGQTIAEGIAVKEVGEITKEICREFVREVVEVGESELEQAVNLFCNVEKTIAEGAGAAGLAALLSYPEKFKGKKVGLILSGGNIDPRLLASVLTRSLVREKRIVRMRVIGDDRPGLLGVVSNIIGSSGGNIIEVAHNRLALDVPAKGAEFDIMVESRDAQHTQEIIEALTEAGYPPRANS
ncbi:threonine ammonia-lyase [Pseudaquidulcibacter saccharophilus]|uniref:threonine ammonia-lyase n=1 Tax=Pseudaquidulcibacter saccharophilus TaxID=2831900 RepID=UPI001EFF06B6|nr:threonine ammonia-lyase [Pseudaquidulcibacter saccharophilus]